MTGIRPKAESIEDKSFGPDGLHLRWSFPPHMGFPAGGFRIYRRPTDKKKNGPKQNVSFMGLPLNQPLSPETRIGDVQFVLVPATTQIVCRPPDGDRFLEVTPSTDALLELRFSEPVTQVHLKIEPINNPSTVRAYSEDQLIAQISEGGGTREVTAPAITRITIQLSFQRLQSIAYTTDAEECNDSNWGNRVKHLQLPVTTQQALELLQPDLRNYYAEDLDNATQRYEPHLQKMINWLRLLQHPTADHFVDPNQQPHLLQIRNDDGKGISNSAYPQSILLLAALDPNIARMLCLYWVDIFKPEGQGDPQKGLAYDYKVEGIWKNGEKLCGLLFNLGAVEARPPILEPKLIGDQLPGQRWSGRTPLGRVGLKWPRPQPAIQTEARAVQPVLYDLFRISEDNSRKWLTETQLVLVPNSAQQDKDAALFIDRDVSLGAHTYLLRPIDLFGQVGKELTAKVKVKDTIAPPPPVRLRTMLYAPNVDPTELHLQFEYGALQHQQAPDIKEFNLYWRPENLFARLPVKVETSHTVQGNQFRYTLRVRNQDGSEIPYDDLSKFTGDVLTNVLSSADQPLPANQRQRYRIDEINPPDNVLLQPTSNVLSDVAYELVGDPHNRAHWTQLTPAPVSWREPISGVVRTIQEGLPVEVRFVRTITPSPDPFASVPEDQRKSFPTLRPIPEIVEAEISRDLMEADVFTGDLERDAPSGIARTEAGNDFNILYAVSSTGSGAGARIGLPSDAAVSKDDVLSLIPQPQVKEKIRYLAISGTVDDERLGTPGGEIAFEETRDGVEITHVARVISSAVNRAGTFGFLARFTSKDAAHLLQPNMSVRYYAPYRIKLDVSLADEADALIKLSIPSDAGSRSAYIAVSAKDERTNEGPLCTPSQFTVVKPKPSGKPPQPYPCQLAANAEARYSTPGYATPPDRQGRATICLKWEADGVSPASGLRYEVARALDNGILAAHLRNWQMGKSQADDVQPLVAGAKVTGDLNVNPDSVRGLYRATFTPDADVPDPSIFRKGRLSRNGVYFEVTLAKRRDINNLDLLLRATGQTGPVNGPAELEAPPNYNALQNNKPRDEDVELNVVAALRQLATQNPEAFGMATGVPITATEFTDEVPGIGRNRFFYRVRAVDAAENRSDWSAVSAPFFQVDTTTPEAPREFQVFPGDRRAALLWCRSNDPLITEYRVFRRVGDGPDPEPGRDAPHAQVRHADLGPRRLSAVGGSLSLPRPVEVSLPAGATVADVEARIVVRPLTAASDAPNLFVAGSSHAIVQAQAVADGTARFRVITLYGLRPVPPETALLVTIDEQTIDGDVDALAWMDEGLSGGIRYTYRLAAVKRVRTGGLGEGQPARDIDVPSRLTAPLTVVPVDRSVPPAPAITEVVWLDGGAVGMAGSPAQVVRLTLQAAADTTASVLVERRWEGDARWSNASVEGRSGWRPWPATAEKLVVHDFASDPAAAWFYRARLRTRDGRTSPPSAETTLSPRT